MKFIKIFLAAITVISCLLLSSCSGNEKPDMTAFITEVQKISELYLLKIYHGDYLEFTQGKNERNIIYTGEALIGIDLKDSNFKCKNDKYIIKLPVPNVKNVKLIEKECQVVSSKGKYFAWKHTAENILKEKVNKKEYIDSAKEQAEQLFKAIFESQGYTVEIVWK